MKDVNINDAIKDTGKIADNLITSKEEKLILENKDRESARKRDIEAQKEENASWLSKNIAPILALLIFALTSFIVYSLIFNEIPEGNKDILQFVFGLIIGGGFVQIFNYYFGTSSSSSNKDKIFKKFFK